VYPAMQYTLPVLRHSDARVHVRPQLLVPSTGRFERIGGGAGWLGCNPGVPWRASLTSCPSGAVVPPTQTAARHPGTARWRSLESNIVKEA
jgi:hypothetical protein